MRGSKTAATTRPLVRLRRRYSSSTHSPTHPLTHSPTHPLTHSPTHPLTHSPLTHSPLTTHSLSSQMYDFQIAPFVLQIFQHQPAVAMFGGWFAAQQHGWRLEQRGANRFFDLAVGHQLHEQPF